MKKKKKRDAKSKTKEETKEDKTTTDRKLESTKNKRKYNYKNRNLIPYIRISNFKIDDYVNFFMRKCTNDLKTVNKHKKNSKYFEHKKKSS